MPTRKPCVAPRRVLAPAIAPPTSMASTEISQVTNCDWSLSPAAPLALRTKSRMTLAQTVPPAARTTPAATRPQAIGGAAAEAGVGGADVVTTPGAPGAGAGVARVVRSGSGRQ